MPDLLRRTLSAIGAAGCLLAIVVAPPPARSADPEIVAVDRTEAVAAILRRADGALAAGRPSEALAQYERALRLDPGSPGIQYGRARALDLLGREGEAAIAYRALLRQDPDHAGAIAGLAALIGQNDPEAALGQLRPLLARRPDDPYLASRVARIEATLGNWPAAATLFAQAADALPEDAAAQHNLAVALDVLGDKRAAIAAYERVLGLPPAPGVPLTQVRERLRSLREP